MVIIVKIDHVFAQLVIIGENGQFTSNRYFCFCEIYALSSQLEMTDCWILTDTDIDTDCWR